MDADNVKPDNFERLILLLKRGDERAWLQQKLRCNHTRRCRFDEANGNQLPLSTHECSKADMSPDEPHDYLWYIVNYSFEAFQNLLSNMRSNIQRNYELLPAYSARELDAKSAIWISRQPGRNIREKLNHTRRLLAVQRHFSCDTAENRLLKAFAQRLCRCLNLYMEVYEKEAPKCMTEMWQLAARWLRSEEAAEIGPWQHIPPNNTLLQHKLYRKIWDSWMRLQRMDEVIAHDCNNLSSLLFFNMGWNLISRLQKFCDFRLLQHPLKNNYEFISLHCEQSLRGWVPSCQGETFQALPITIEMKHKGLCIHAGPHSCISVRLSEDGKVCYLPNGIQKTNIWNTTEASIIEDTIFNELVSVKPSPLLASLVEKEEEIAGYLHSAGLPETVNTPEEKFNQLYHELRCNLHESIAYRLHHAFMEYGPTVILQGLRYLLNPKNLPTQVENLLWDIVYLIAKASEWAEYCETDELCHNRADSFKLLCSLLDDAEHQVWYGDYLSNLAEKTHSSALYVKAYYWYTRAAEKNYEWAFYNLGRCSEKGLGCPEDLARAIEYYQRSGTHEACYSLGCIYEKQHNSKEAEKWFSLAMEKGHPNAENKVREISSSLLRRSVVSYLKFIFKRNA